jgi:hypothetical protein
MKKLSLLLVAALGLSASVFAEDTKLEGKAVCAKCELHQSDKCRAAVQVTGADGKTETYLTEANDKAKELHHEICKGGKEAEVTGTVTEKDGQKLLTVTDYKIK